MVSWLVQPFLTHAVLSSTVHSTDAASDEHVDARHHAGHTPVQLWNAPAQMLGLGDCCKHTRQHERQHIHGASNCCGAKAAISE